MIEFFKELVRKPRARELMFEHLQEAERQLAQESLELERTQAAVTMLKQRVKRLQHDLEV